MEDRLSNLPKHLTEKILSYTDTRSVVKACVLSKRWKNLWRSVPYLDFDVEAFLDEDSDSSFEGERSSQVNEAMRQLEDVTTQVLLRRKNTNLKKLRLNSSTYGRYGTFVEGVVSYALAHKVQDLSITCFESSPLRLLPEALFHNKSLQKLHIQTFEWMGPFLELPKLFTCKGLKSLHLSGLFLTGPNFSPTLFSGCPQLESLKLLDISISEDKHLNIKSSKLTNLKISFQRAGYQICRCSVALDTPKLQVLKYRGYIPGVSVSGNSVAEHVQFDILHYEENESELALQFLKSLQQFPRTKFLCLSSRVIQILASYPGMLEEHTVALDSLKIFKVNIGLFMPNFDPPDAVKRCLFGASTEQELRYIFSRRIR